MRRIGTLNWKTVLGFAATGLSSLFLLFGNNESKQITPSASNELTEQGDEKGIIRSWVGGWNWKKILRTTAEATGISEKHPKVYFGGDGPSTQVKDVEGPVEIDSEIDAADIPPTRKTVSKEVLETADTIFDNKGASTHMETCGSLKITTKINRGSVGPK